MVGGEDEGPGEGRGCDGEGPGVALARPQSPVHTTVSPRTVPPHTQGCLLSPATVHCVPDPVQLSLIPTVQG